MEGRRNGRAIMKQARRQKNEGEREGQGGGRNSFFVIFDALIPSLRNIQANEQCAAHLNQKHGIICFLLQR